MSSWPVERTWRASRRSTSKGSALRWYLSLARNTSLGVAALVALLMGWLYYRRLRPKQSAPPPASQTQPDSDRLAELAKVGPERLAKVLARWIDQTELTVEQPAARAAA